MVVNRANQLAKQGLRLGPVPYRFQGAPTNLRLSIAKCVFDQAEHLRISEVQLAEMANRLRDVRLHSARMCL